MRDVSGWASSSAQLIDMLLPSLCVVVGVYRST